MKGVDLFRFILVNTGTTWVLSSATSHRTRYFSPVAVWPFTHPWENTFTHSNFTHLEEFILKCNFKLFFLLVNKWFITTGVDLANASYMKPEEKQERHDVVTLRLAAAQRVCCSPPMIRWVVHPEDVRAFSCGVTATCACLSCGRRWLRVGGGCCQMMAPGGAMCEMKVGGEWGRKK